jgi:predicted anti-sigma-YlaC factor YlaD
VQHVYHLLNAYYDNELSPGTCKRVETHIESCSSCRAELEQLGRLSTFLSEYVLPDSFAAPEVFQAQVALRVSRRMVERSKYRGVVWHLVPVTLLAVVVLVQALLALSGIVMMVTRSVEWLGIDVGSAVAQVSIAWPQAGTVIGLPVSSMVALSRFALVAGLYIGLIVLFVPYVGWVGALWRSMRADQGSGRP